MTGSILNENIYYKILNSSNGDGYSSDEKLSAFVHNIVPELQFSGDSDEAKNRDDLHNAKLLYRQLKLTPQQASDPKFWSALCRIYKDYVHKRWGKNSGIDRFNVHECNRVSLCCDNALSRLFMSAHLTYDDEDKDNPFHLTEVLFSAQKIQKDLIKHPMSMNKKIVKGVLKALQRIQRDFGGKATAIFRECCWTYLNRLGVVVMIDCLETEEIENLAYEFMRKNFMGVVS